MERETSSVGYLLGSPGNGTGRAQLAATPTKNMDLGTHKKRETQENSRTMIGVCSSLILNIPAIHVNVPDIRGGSWDFVATDSRTYNPTSSLPKWPYLGYPNYSK